MKRRFGELLSVLEEYNLGACVKFLLEHNAAQALPYHGLAHCFQVAYTSYLIWTEGYSAKLGPCPKYLLIAALFHDFNHSGGFHVDDNRNVDAAIDGAYKFLLEDNCETTGALGDKAMVFEYTVLELIRATKYPLEPVSESKAKSAFPHFMICVDILCDADMMRHTNALMLGDVIGIKNELFKRTPWPEYMQATIEFLQGINYRTAPAKLHGGKRLEEIIDNLKRFGKLTNTL